MVEPFEDQEYCIFRYKVLVHYASHKIKVEFRSILVELYDIPTNRRRAIKSIVKSDDEGSVLGK